MHERENALREWVSTVLKDEDFDLKPLFGDASFRRYFRLQHHGFTHIVMDAPPGKENLEPFIHVAQTLAKAGVLTPEILAIDKRQGFLICTDFGDQLMLNQLKPNTVDDYYYKACKILHKIQQVSFADPQLPVFDYAFMIKEMNLCDEWFFKAYLGLRLTDKEQALFHNTSDWIANEVARQPLVVIHRDYHSRNIMLTGDDSFGVIDFQDAMQGPFTYDLVSLLKDCYISWPRTKVLEWVAAFHADYPQGKTYSLEDFIRAFDLCGLQRHIKVLGVFCRLSIRDNKPNYLKDLPLTLSYVRECCEIYPELHSFHDFLQERVQLP